MRLFLLFSVAFVTVVHGSDYVQFEMFVDIGWDCIIVEDPTTHNETCYTEGRDFGCVGEPDPGPMQPQ